MSQGLNNAAALVLLLKEAGVGDLARRGLEAGQGLATGVYRTLGAGSRAAGEEASKALGGGIVGEAARLGIRAAPWVGGAALADYALGSPVSDTAKRIAAQEKQRLKARIAATRAVWDPERQMMI